MSNEQQEQSQDEPEGGPLSALARLLRSKLSAKGIMVLMIDADNDIALGTSGFHPEKIPSVLSFVRKIVQARNRGERPTTLNADEIIDAGQCPSCGVSLLFPREPFQQTAQKYVVCACGSFLVPVVIPDAPISMRCLTIDEVAELPDEVRNNLLRSRREQEARTEQDE